MIRDRVTDSVNARMVKAENPLKEDLGEGAIRGLDRWHGQKSPESEVTEWTRGCRRRAKKTNGSITNVPRIPWPRPKG